MFKMTTLALAFSAGMIGSAFAGEQYVDGTGFAASGYDVVSYFDLPQSEIGQAQQSPLEGMTAITADYNGATFAFATEENRARFLADPAASRLSMTGIAHTVWPRGARCPAILPCGESWMESCISTSPRMSSGSGKRTFPAI